MFKHLFGYEFDDVVRVGVRVLGDLLFIEPLITRAAIVVIHLLRLATMKHTPPKLTMPLKTGFEKSHAESLVNGGRRKPRRKKKMPPMREDRRSEFIWSA